MAKFRKKPVVVEAFQFEGMYQVLPQWMLEQDADWEVKGDEGGMVLLINTLEGQMKANVGDWIIRGVKGELYPIKDLIFRATYELAEGGEI